jgi:signal transduction histidine kinase
MKSRRHPDISLIWRGALIVLPVAILSGIALYSLREDKASIEKEARDRAQVLAPELARRLGERVGQTIKRQSAQFSQGVIAGGRILSPRDYPLVPRPADWPQELTPGQARLWQAAQASIFQAQDLEAARRAFVSLTASGASVAARANAEFGLLLLEAKRGASSPAVAKQATDLARRYREVPAESGAPLADLSLLLALKHSKAGHLPDGFMRELPGTVSEHPSFLTSELLEAAERVGTDPETRRQVGALKTAWLRQEVALALLRALMRHPLDSARPSETWLETDAHLALASPVPGGWQVLLAPAPLLEQAFLNALMENPAQLPAYAAAVVEIGGKRWRIGRGSQNPDRTGQSEPVILGSAAGRLEIGSSHPFTLSLNLANPELLFAGYRRRLWLTAALILSAAAAALVGLASFWQGFRRQVRISEMQSNFVSSVSHELRAPIAAVRLMAESLDRGRIADEAKQRDYLRLIVQECRRVSSLVENVLDFSRIDQGRKRYSFEPLDLVALVSQTVALMEPCAAERQVNLSLVEPPSEAASLRPCWDNHAVEQSMLNLLDNAIKHSPAGATVKVRIEVVEVEGKPPVRVCVWIEDQGQGMPAEVQARIFELFYRHGSELRRETKGVGIGLSIVKHVAEAHGGRVLVQSAVEQGSRFGLELPLAPPGIQKRERL